jgi:hypothetical protein
MFSLVSVETILGGNSLAGAALSGSLLKPKVEVDPMAGVQGVEQRGELGWWPMPLSYGPR